MEYFSHKIPFVSIFIPLGGLLGKSFSTANLHLKIPPSYGVPTGPSISA